MDSARSNQVWAQPEHLSASFLDHLWSPEVYRAQRDDHARLQQLHALLPQIQNVSASLGEFVGDRGADPNFSPLC